MRTEHYLVHVLGIIPKFRAKVCVHCSMSFNIPAVRVLPTVQRIWWRFRLGSFSKLMLDFKLCADRFFSHFTATELIVSWLKFYFVLHVKFNCSFI